MRLHGCDGWGRSWFLYIAAILGRDGVGYPDVLVEKSEGLWAIGFWNADTN